jgi:leucyl aminopeptidase
MRKELPFSLPRTNFELNYTIEAHKADLHVVFAINGKYMEHPFGKLPMPKRFEKVGLDLEKEGSHHVFEHNKKAFLVIVLEKTKPHVDKSQLIAGNIIGMTAKKMQCHNILVAHYGDYDYDTLEAGICGITPGINDALYEYKQNHTVGEVSFYVPPELEDNGRLNLIAEMQHSINGNNLYRDLLMMPSNQLGPKALNQVALSLKKHLSLTAGVQTHHRNYSTAELKKSGHNLLTAVGDSVPHDPAQLIMLEYRGTPESDEVDHLIVCKGICMDTGGINLKPTASIANMKMDMGGAALGLGLFYSMAMNKNPQNIVLMIPAAYNFVSEYAMNPGDIYTSNGTSVEITNTDAEGRLALADGISFACNKLGIQPKHITTLATLTGAARVALGKYHTPFCARGNWEYPFTLDDVDPLYQLPLTEGHLKAMQRTETADLTNSDETGGGAGVSTAAAFIGHFVPEHIAWLHVDFSNVAKNAQDVSGNEKSPKQATGRAFYPLLEFLSD